MPQWVMRLEFSDIFASTLLLDNHWIICVKILFDDQWSFEDDEGRITAGDNLFVQTEVIRTDDVVGEEKSSNLVLVRFDEVQAVVSASKIEIIQQPSERKKSQASIKKWKTSPS